MKKTFEILRTKPRGIKSKGIYYYRDKNDVEGIFS